MTKDEYLALLGRGDAAWNAWRAEHDERPDLSGAALRGLDLSRFDLSRADLRDADLRGTRCCDADLSGAHLEGANLFKAVLDRAELAGAFLHGVQFLNCAQLGPASRPDPVLDALIEQEKRIGLRCGS